MSYKQIIIFIMITLLASCNNDNRIAMKLKNCHIARYYFVKVIKNYHVTVIFHWKNCSIMT